MLPPRSGSSCPSLFSSLWTWATTSSPAAAPPARGDLPVAASSGISNTLSESLSHTIAVQPLGARPPGINPLARQEDPPAPRDDHVIDIPMLPTGHGGATPDNKHAAPPDHVIDIRRPSGDEDEDAPDELRAPARRASGPHRQIPELRLDVPEAAISAVNRVAERKGAGPTEPDVVTTSETWRLAGRMGMEQAACGFLTQLAGRTAGLLVTSALRRTDEGAALGSSLGLILASNLLFAGRTATLITRALGGEYPLRTDGSGNSTRSTVTDEEARLARASRIFAAALAVVPFLTQAMLPIVGMYAAGSAVGVKIAATIVGRLAAALLRDGLTQAAARGMTSVEVVRANGVLPDSHTVRDKYDPLRIDLAVAMYTMTSGLFLIGTADAMADAILPDTAATFAEMVRKGMGFVLASSINEGLDGLMPSIARAGAALHYGLRLAPKGWHAQRERERAERLGSPPRQAGNNNPPTQPQTWGEWLTDWARRTQAHAGMRMTFGTLTADPWNALADIRMGASPAEAMMFRTVGAIFNGQTGRRGYTVELGNQPTEREIDRKDAEAKEKLDQKLEKVDWMTTSSNPRFHTIREDMRLEFRRRLLASGAVPEDAPDREERLKQLDLAIDRGAGAWLDRKADVALKNEVRDEIRRRHPGAYRFVVESVVNEGEMIEAGSLQTSSEQSAAQTRGPSALASHQGSPLPKVRRIQPVDDLPPGPPVVPLQPQDLQAGRAIRLDNEAVTFLRRQEDGALVVRATRHVVSLGWTPAPDEGEHVYTVDPITIVTISAGVDDGAGTGLQFAGPPPGMRPPGGGPG